MIKLKLTLPKYKVGITITSKKGRPDPILTLFDELAKVRVGSRFSRLVRRLAASKRVHRLLGGLLVIFIIGSNLFPPSSSAFSAQNEVEVLALPAGEEPVITSIARRNPVDGKISITQSYRFFHPGVDIDGVTGDPIYPIMNGKVESAGKEFFLGKTVRIDHGNGYKSTYAHLDTIGVKAGDEINTKTKLGKMGNTGRSFGDHLHLEVQKDGRNINPISVLPRR